MRALPLEYAPVLTPGRYLWIIAALLVLLNNQI